MRKLFRLLRRFFRAEDRPVGCTLGVTAPQHETPPPPDSFPPRLLDSPEDTDVIGDVDSFLAEIQDGRARQEYVNRLRQRLELLEEFSHD